jgi:hypothetical protein
VKAGVTELVLQSSDDLTVGSVSTEVTFGAPNLSAVRQLLTTTLTDGVVSIDLVNATIAFDLAKLAYGPAGLNGLPANTRVAFDAATAQSLTERTSALLEAWREAIAAEIEKALAATSFTMDTTVVLQADDPLLGKVDVAEVSVGYATTVGAFQSEPPPAPTVSTKVLGLGLPGLEALLEPITAALLARMGDVVADALDDVLFGPGALVPVTAAAIQSAALPVTEAAESALTPLADTLTLTVNVQPDQPGAPDGTAVAGTAAAGQYKVSALRIAAVGSTAEIYFATAAAGPIVFRRGAG